MPYNNQEFLERTRIIHKSTLGPSMRIALLLTLILGLAKSVLSLLTGAITGESWAELGALVNELKFVDQAEAGDVLQVLEQSLPAVLISLAISTILGWVLFIFFDAVVRVGYRRWFSRNRELTSIEGVRQTPANRLLFSLFTQDDYLPTVKACFYKNLRLWLWTLPFYLLSIGVGYMSWRMVKQNLTINYLFDTNPQQADVFYQTEWVDFGVWEFLLVTLLLLSLALYISKRLEYSQTDWFLADNPHLGGQRALELSEQLMRGKKMARLRLAISYLPWFLLPLLMAFVPFLLYLDFILLPLLVLFVDSRYHQAQAEFYAMIREEAVNQGLVTMEDLGYHKAV